MDQMHLYRLLKACLQLFAQLIWCVLSRHPILNYLFAVTLHSHQMVPVPVSVEQLLMIQAS